MLLKLRSTSSGRVARPAAEPADDTIARSNYGEAPRNGKRYALRYFDELLGTTYVHDVGLNWKGRACERAIVASRHVGRSLRWILATTIEVVRRPFRRALQLFDELLGTTAIRQADLNWKGRLSERTIGTSHRWYVRARGRIDELLGTTHVYQSNLNWKGRLIERMLGVRFLFRRVVGRLDELFGTTHVNAYGLNWRGRVIERALGVGRAVRWRLRRFVHATIFAAVDWPCFYLYRMLGRRHSRVRSVLHLSILSHKPLMISRVQREEGLKADFFALNADIASPVLNLGSDYSMPFKIGPWKRRVLQSYYLWTVLARYDVIHSHFKTMLSETGWEFDFLKRLGTIVVFHFRGCDLRYRSLNMQLFPDLNICAECDYPVGSCDTDYQRQQVGIARRLGDLFFVTTPDMQGFLPGAVHVPFIHPTGIDFDSIVPAPRTPGVFRIVTSSNHPGIDGTRFVRDAVARLQAEGEAIELVEVADVKYREALSIYKSADAFVGKLRMGYYNNANIETMMLGVPNFSYVRDEYLRRIPDCPIIVTTPETVYPQLRKYLSLRDELKAIGALGPEFVRRHHDPRLIARYMIGRYNEVLSARRAGSSAPMPLDTSSQPMVPLLRADLSVVERKQS